MCLCSVIVCFFLVQYISLHQVRVRQVEALVKLMQGTTRFEWGSVVKLVWWSCSVVQVARDRLNTMGIQGVLAPVGSFCGISLNAKLWSSAGASISRRSLMRVGLWITTPLTGFLLNVSVRVWLSGSMPKFMECIGFWFVPVKRGHQSCYPFGQVETGQSLRKMGHRRSYYSSHNGTLAILLFKLRWENHRWMSMSKIGQ